MISFHKKDKSNSEPGVSLKKTGHVYEIYNLMKIYNINHHQVVAINNFCLNIEKGEMIAIVGPSGSGKSTLLNMLGGLCPPSAGSIKCDDEDIYSFNRDDLIRFYRKNIGFVFQFFNLISTLTVEENIAFPLKIIGYNRDEVCNRVNELLDLFQLKEKKQNFPHQLSGGEQQMVAIAIALAPNPKVILADEPTGELDCDTGTAIIQAFEKLRNNLNKTIIIVTHNYELTKYCDKTLVLKDGRIQKVILKNNATDNVNNSDFQSLIDDEIVPTNMSSSLEPYYEVLNICQNFFSNIDDVLHKYQLMKDYKDFAKMKKSHNNLPFNNNVRATNNLKNYENKRRIDLNSTFFSDRSYMR